MDINSGILLIANSLLLGFILYYSVKLLLAYHMGLQIESPLSFIVKILLFSIFMNFSLFFCEQIINLTSYISLSIRSIGENLFNKEICFTTFINQLNSTLFVDGSSLNVFSIDGLLKSIVSFGFFNLILSYALRYVMLKVLVLITPFAFLTLITKNTDWFFKSWLKSFLSLLFMQILISIILLICFSINSNLLNNASDIFNKLILLGSVYALIKVNDFIKEFMGGLTTTVQGGIANFRNNS